MHFTDPEPLSALLSASGDWSIRAKQLLGGLGYSGSPQLRLPTNENSSTLLRHLSRYTLPMPSSLLPWLPNRLGLAEATGEGGEEEERSVDISWVFIR